MRLQTLIILLFLFSCHTEIEDRYLPNLNSSEVSQIVLYDDFNRADGGTLGSNWSIVPNGGTFGILSNTAVPNASGATPPMAFYIIS